MPLDGITLHLLNNEIRSRITGCKIDKIYQPNASDLVFHLRSRSEAVNLYISASPSIPRIYLTNTSPANPPVPPMFCMFLRKHLTGCVIDGIDQTGMDRVITFNISGSNEIGDYVKFSLVFECMPKHSNFIVVNSEGIIIESIRKTFATQNSSRQIQPGFKFIPAPYQNKTNILNADEEQISNAINSNGSKMLSSVILNTYEGISPLVSREISSRTTAFDKACSELTNDEKVKLVKAITNYKNLILNGGVPTLLYDENNKPFDFSYDDITQYGFRITGKTMNSYSELIEKYYADKGATESSLQQSRELLKIISTALERSKRKLETRKTELENCKDKDSYRINAELILANQYNLKKGVDCYEIPNFYDNYSLIKIKAEPSLSPSANAQKYFKEYNKLKNAEKLLGALIEDNEIEITYLDNVFDSIKRSDSYTLINEIKNELYEQGYLKRNSNKGKKLKPQPPIQYISDDGYTILVGRNNIQNEILDFKTAMKDDSWFHVQSFPGSHVVVIGNGDIIPETTCRQAAVIAAFNSSAKDSSQVAVDYTIIKELKKPKNGKPGMVIYHKYNTMWVTPDRELCERLRKK